jgi:hypothetical protein
MVYRNFPGGTLLKTNLSIRNKPGPLRGRGGRPRSKGSVHKPVKISDELYNVLYSERKPGERFNDTIKRIIVERGRLSQEVDRLKAQLLQDAQSN